MSEEGGGLPVVRVKFACANVEEFRRKFEANLLAKGMLARTPQMHEVGKRLMLRLELQDGSLGVDEEAVVQALEWTGGKQAMRLQLLRAKNPAMPAPAPMPMAAAPPAAPAAGPQVVALPPPRAATGTAIPAATDWATKAPERARTDTETTRAMSLDELLNALPPTAKPKLTPSGGVPHLNGASTRPSGPRPAAPFQAGGFNPAPPPPSAMPLAPPISAPPPAPAADQSFLPPTPVVPAPSHALVRTPAAPARDSSPPPAQTSSPPQADFPPAAAVPAEVMTFQPPVTSSLPPTIADSEPPPAIRAMTPMYPMPTPFPSTPPPAAAAPAPGPEPEPESSFPIMSAAAFKASLTGEITVGREGASTELADSIRESIQPEPEPGVDPAGPTVFNTATEATTASNATIAVPELASAVNEARKRGPGRAIATFVLFLAALSGAGAYLWRTGQLEEYAPALAARLPPSPASTAAQPAPAPAPVEAPKPPAPAAEAAPAPPAEAPKPPAPAAEAAPAPPAEAPKSPAPTAEAPKPPDNAAATPEPPAPAAAEGPQVKLIITTDPPGAKVLANGEPVGASPLELPWASGKPIKLRFTKPGFRPANRSFTPNATGTLDVTLAPAEAQTNELKDVY